LVFTFILSFNLIPYIWYWKPADEKVYTVKSAYDLVSDLMLTKEDFSFSHNLAFKVVWKSSAPSKTAGFAWLVLLDRIPTRANLFRRQVLRGDDEQCCVFCRREVETTSHLFLYCNGIMQVWDRVFCWLGMKFSLPHTITSILNLMASTRGSKQARRGMVMIWISLIWTVWRHRNRIIFENGSVNLTELLDDVKIMSWKWWIGKLNSPPPLLYEWISEPTICLARGC
jgi:hypothetical protein